MVKHEFIEANLEIVRKLIKLGDMSGTVLAQYKIYRTYYAETVGEKMQRYHDTAEVHKCSTRTVMTAVKCMETKI